MNFDERYLIVGTGIAYAIVAIMQFYKGSMSNGIVYSGYAFSNIGLFMLAKV